jgi:hypothetical protein
VSPENDPRLLELLAGKVLGDLDEAEQLELEQLTSSSNEAFSLELETRWELETWELEKTAAAVQLALAGSHGEEMPASVLQQIRQVASKHVASNLSEVASSQDEATRPRLDTRSPSLATSASASTSRFTVREMVAWLACAAAILVCIGLLRRGDTTPAVASASELREKLLRENAEDLLTVEWAAGTTPFDNDVAGDVVWHNDSQIGFMRFVGLPVNDVTVEQYQLWIIDPGRDDEPIDGGVFDSNSSGEIVVPILAKLNVVSPQAFAITIEKPGGVVVSTQERLPLLAAVQ